VAYVGEEQRVAVLERSRELWCVGEEQIIVVLKRSRELWCWRGAENCDDESKLDVGEEQKISPCFLRPLLTFVATFYIKGKVTCNPGSVVVTPTRTHQPQKRSLHCGVRNICPCQSL
jgi:hypothetical protein